jgi:cysteine-rich repeat protein
MINKKIIFAGVFFFMIFSLLGVFAEEDYYVKLDFNENFNNLGSGFSSDFSFAGLENIYGNYDTKVREYNSLGYEGMYELRVYNEFENMLGSYAFESALIGFYDNFGNTEDMGGIYFSDSGVNSVIIPYGSNYYIGRIFYNEELKTEFYFSGVWQNRSCLMQGEFSAEDRRCCEGLTQSWVSSNDFTCIKCGDGICSEFENSYLCFNDCSDERETICADGRIKGKYGCVEAGVCGNGIVDNGEECDDGANFNGDGCSSNGNIEYCFDFDGFLEFDNSIFNSSRIFGSGEYREDECVDEKSLKEYYCGYNIQWDFWNMKKIVKSSIIECEFGCIMGECLREAINETNLTVASCFDSDGGLNYDVKGTAFEYGTPFAYDECTNSVNLYELSCNDGIITESFYDCPNGCLDGACVREILDLPPEPENPERV